MERCALRVGRCSLHVGRCTLHVGRLVTKTLPKDAKMVLEGYQHTLKNRSSNG